MSQKRSPCSDPTDRAALCTLRLSHGSRTFVSHRSHCTSCSTCPQTACALLTFSGESGKNKRKKWIYALFHVKWIFRCSCRKGERKNCFAFSRLLIVSEIRSEKSAHPVNFATKEVLSRENFCCAIFALGRQKRFGYLATDKASCSALGASRPHWWTDNAWDCRMMQ